MNTKIVVETRTVYGIPRLYVVSEHKEALLTLTNKATIDRKDIEALKQLGFTFEALSVKIEL